MTVWGRLEDVPYCIYLSGRMELQDIARFAQRWSIADPFKLTDPSGTAYACIWHEGDAELAWTFLSVLLEWFPFAETRTEFVDSFLHKFWYERDLLTVYRHVIHPDRKQEGNGDATDWTEAIFLQTATDIVRFHEPLISVGRYNPPRPPAYCDTRYTGDPKGRREYTGISTHPVRVRYGGDNPAGIVYDSELYVTVQAVEEGNRPRYYVFFDRFLRWERWFEEAC